MRLIRNIILSFFIILFTLPTSAQYDFGNKELKKIYSKLEKAYDDYDYQTILDYEDKVLELVEPKQDTLTALIYSFLAEAYLDFDYNPDKCLNYYQKEYDLRLKIQSEDDELIKNTAFNMAFIMDEVGKYKDAEILLLDLIEKDKKSYGTKSSEYINTSLKLGQHYQYTKQYEDYKKGLKLYKGLFKFIKKDNPLYGELLNGIGGTYDEMGSYEAAETNYLNALDAFETSGQYASLNTVINLNSLGLMYEKTGRLPEAEETYNEALSILNRLSGDNEDIFQTIFNNLGGTYYLLGKYTEADRELQKAVLIAEDFYGNDSDVYAIALSSQADSYFFQKRYDEAEVKFKQALDIFIETQGEDSYDAALMTYNLSRVYREKRLFDKALEFNKKAIENLKASIGEEDDEYVRSLMNLGAIQNTIHNYAEASDYYNQALKIRKKTLGVNHPRYAETTQKLALLNWAMDNKTEAIDYYKQTFENYFTQIEAYFPTMTEEEKAKFYNTKVKTTFEQFNSYAFDKGIEDKSLWGEMYNYQLATKGLIMYATGKVRTSIMNSGDTVLIDKYQTWISQKEQLSKLFSSVKEDIFSRNFKIDSITRAADKLEKEISVKSKAFANTYTQNRVTWQQVQQKLKPGEAAVEIIRFRSFKPDSAGLYTDEIYYAGLVLTSETTENPELVVLRNGKQMENKFLSNYRNAIKYKVEEAHSYRLFWRPIANKLNGIKKVYLSPDGIYNQISINTLQNPATKKYTLDELEIKVVTNTKDLVLSASAGSSNLKRGKAHLFGFPNYNMGEIEDKQENEGTDEIKPAGQRSVRGSRATRGSGIRGGISRGLRGNLQRYINSNSLLAMLPGTKIEIENIAKQYELNGMPPSALFGNDAMEDSVKNLNNPQTLHIATHGFFLENQEPEEGIEIDKYVENPLLRSGLILAGANSFLQSGSISNDRQDGQDGILTAYEAMNLNLDQTDLVVLSACETGLGEISNGEGVYGLQRSFQIAGAKSVIMSMWTVDDAATQELMTNFYSEWLKTGDKNKSFINAQKKLKEKWKSPYYWGAFVMVGF
ncbi:CHAT domain-containing tetratricopeptide repeat protein [Reichenbachiella sp. MALMAid0571]|uniref:CHAT domain-containing protein n=1 Tax=Reichenbachiella sp. MALMAid0571 TaxID=3143939 RepID=UPI0032DE8F33